MEAGTSASIFLTAAPISGRSSYMRPPGASIGPRSIMPSDEDADHTVEARGRNDNNNSSAAVTKTIGKMTSLIDVQPNFSSI